CEDGVEAESAPARPPGLGGRWAGRRPVASPFGRGLRPAPAGGGAGADGVPFPAWQYRPAYLPAPLAFDVGRDVPLSEPFWFHLGFGRRPDDPGRPTRQPFDHAAGLRAITGVRLAGPGVGRPSAGGRAVARLGVATLDDAPG